MSVLLTVCRACLFWRCSGKEKGTLPYPNWPGRTGEGLLAAVASRLVETDRLLLPPPDLRAAELVGLLMTRAGWLL